MSKIIRCLSVNVPVLAALAAAEAAADAEAAPAPVAACKMSKLVKSEVCSVDQG